MKNQINESANLQKFLIVSIPRSGSNMLVGMLDQHPEIQCYAELFHPDKIYNRDVFSRHGIPDFTLNQRNKDPFGYLDYIFRHKFKQNTKAIGFKIFPGQNDELLQLLLQDSSIKKIILIRDNLLRCYLSLKSAELNNVYFIREGSEQIAPSDQSLVLDVKDFIQYQKENTDFFNRILSKLKKSGLEYLVLHYENLLDREQQLDLLNFIGIKPDPGLLKVISVKQRKKDITEKIINFDETKEWLSSLYLTQYLEEEKI